MAWLPVDPKVHPGTVVSLDKDDSNRWTVEKQYSVQEADALHTKWGLDLPRSQRTER